MATSHTNDASQINENCYCSEDDDGQQTVSEHAECPRHVYRCLFCHQVQNSVHGEASKSSKTEHVAEVQFSSLQHAFIYFNACMGAGQCSICSDLICAVEALNEAEFRPLTNNKQIPNTKQNTMGPAISVSSMILSSSCFVICRTPVSFARICPKSIPSSAYPNHYFGHCASVSLLYHVVVLHCAGGVS
jgi:hypothetical protein